jgi:polysaccharide export outer membrane protein
MMPAGIDKLAGLSSGSPARSEALRSDIPIFALVYSSMKRLFLLVASIAMLSSCVPLKKYVYLQKDDVKKKNLPIDTAVREYRVRLAEYKIQPLDILSIKFESLTEDEYNFVAKLYPITEQSGGGGGGSSAGAQAAQGFVVDPNGEIKFPVVGKIKFGGLSVFEAQENLEKVFSPFLENPVARVAMLNFRFTVLGEVRAEQQVISRNTRVTLMEAIAMAGGLTEFADKSKVKVIRHEGEDAVVMYFNLLDETLLTTNHYYMHQNDIVVVPPLKQRTFMTYWSENLALFVSTLSVVLLIIDLTTDGQ